MSFESLRYDVRDRAAWITLDRPDDLNCMDDRMVRELRAAIDQAEDDASARVVVVTGAGRAFCAGADLKHVLAILMRQDAEEIRQFMKAARELFNRVEACEKPLIAAVNGIAVAGGLELILCCDLVVAVESAKIGDAHANYGLLPGGGASVRLPHKVGPTRAKQLLFSGEFLPAATLAEWGLVNEVVPDGTLEAAVADLTGRLAGKSPLVLRRMKHLVDNALKSSPEAALRAETKAWEAHALSADLKEGLAAFSEKREPDYEGR